MAKKFCTECGAQLEEDARFCPECGTKIPVEPAPADEQPKQQAENKQQAETSRQPENNTQSQPYIYAPQPQGNGYYNRGQNSGGYQTPPNGAYGNQGNYGLQTAPVMSIGSYLLTFFILSIPVVGLIMFIVWALDKSNPNRRNMLLAQLIWALVCTVAVIVLLIIFGSALAAIFGNYSNFSNFSGYYNY